MSNLYKTLFQTQLPSSAGTLATVPALKQWIIKLLTIVNNDASARTFQLWKNGTANTNAITSNAISIPAGGSFVWPDTITLNAGEFLSGIASVASELTITASGDEVS